jgi:ketosteroid isomerase-like protein
MVFRLPTLLFVFLLLTFTPPTMAADTTFEQALATHLAAIDAKDWPGFEKTLTSGDTLTFVAPNGKSSHKTADFKAAMRAWLADADWSWQRRVVSVSATAGTGVAVFHVDYADKDATGKPYSMRYVLSLVFALEASGWKLVHDQNTLLPP